MSGAEMIGVMSSANAYVMPYVVDLWMSLMYRNTVVESVLPCGMPCVIVWCLECAKGV
jgi:hypothetical protein